MFRIFLCFILLMSSTVLARPSVVLYQSRLPTTVKLGFVGDILLHRRLLRQCKRRGIQYLWRPVLPLIRHVDFMVANLEGPIAAGLNVRGRLVSGYSKWDERAYTGYPMFNYPPALAKALQKSNINLATTANNHALDRYTAGVRKTIVVLRQHQIVPLGTRITRQSNVGWFYVSHFHGLDVAWVACTTGTNGVSDPKRLVLRCDSRPKKSIVLHLVRYLSKHYDAVIVLPHWGKEYQMTPTRRQKIFGQAVIKAGALLVVGTHPHVLQPIQLIGQPSRKKMIAYSVGNFVSNQGSIRNRTTMMLSVGLGVSHGRVSIASVCFVPLFMNNRRGLNNAQLIELPQSKRYASSWNIFKKLRLM